MIAVTSRYILHQRNPELLKMIYNPLRRVLFLVIGIILAIGMVVGLSGSTGLPSDRIGGTIFYVFIMAVSLCMAAYSKSMIFSLPDKNGETRHEFCGLVLYKREFSLRGLREVNLELVRMLTRSSGTKRQGLMATWLEKRSIYYKLTLQLQDRRMALDDGTDGEQMRRLGSVLAQILGVSFRVVEG